MKNSLALSLLLSLGTPALGFDGALVFKEYQSSKPVDQIIPSAQTKPYALMTFDEASYDTKGFWNYERNCFEIPEGIAKARFTGQAVFMTNNVGLRQLLVQRSDPGSNFFDFFRGVPIHNTTAVTGTTTDIAFTSAVLPVTEGECYGLMPYQDSGDDLAISGGAGTFFAMRVVQ